MLASDGDKLVRSRGSGGLVYLVRSALVGRARIIVTQSENLIQLLGRTGNLGRPTNRDAASVGSPVVGIALVGVSSRSGPLRTGNAKS